MTMTELDTLSIVCDLIHAKRVWTEGVDIKRFPSGSEELLVVNPFLLHLRLEDDVWWKAAIAFGEYPSRVFPRVVFKAIPPCPQHPASPHPNVDLDDGFLNIRPSLSRPRIRVDHAVALVRYVVTHPVHYHGACQELVQGDVYAPGSAAPTVVAAREATTVQHHEPSEVDLLDVLKSAGEVISVIDAVAQIGKLFAGAIGCLL